MTSSPNQDGFSLIELIMASAILAIMVALVMNLSVSGKDAQEFASRLNHATEVDQDILYGMRQELVSSVHIYSNDTIGNAHLARLDTAAAPPRLPGSRLPTIKFGGNNQKDVVGDEITGNTILFGRLSWTDHYRCASGREYRTDIYRWMHYYLTLEGDGPRPDSPIGLNLVRLVSEPMADGDQIDIVATADQPELLQHLADGTADIVGESHAPVAVVWRRGSDPDATGTFREIDAATGLLSATPLAPRPVSWLIRSDADRSRGMLSYRHFSVATIYALPAMGVGRFGLVDTLGNGFPHGFEVQVVGNGVTKQVLLHLVVSSTNRRGQVAWCDLQSMVDARDQ